MTLREAIQRLQSAYSRGVQSIDTRLTSRHIYSALITARSTVLENQSNQKKFINHWCYQDLSCVEMISAPLHECPCVPAAGCQFLRSKYKLPAFISGIEDSLINTVSTLDGSIHFDQTTFNTLSYTKANKFTSTKERFFLKNGFIYLLNKKELKAIFVSGLFEDVVEAYTFPTVCPCDDCDCKDVQEMPFPLDGRSEDATFKLAQQELIYILKQMNEDKNANASEDDQATGLVHQPKS